MNGRQAPWWVREIVIPWVIVLLAFLAYGLAGAFIEGPLQ